MKFSSLVFISLGIFLGFNIKSIINDSSNVEVVAASEPYILDKSLEKSSELICSENLQIASYIEKNNSIIHNKKNDEHIYTDTISDLVLILSDFEAEKTDEDLERNRIKAINLLNKNESARDEIISLYLDSNQGSDLAQDILEIISNVDSEILHDLSDELIASGMKRSQILGLNLIRNSTDNNTNSFDTIHELISENQVDRSVLLSSIQIISKSSDSLEKKLEILKTLEEHANSGDTEIKLESLLSIGALAKNMDQLKPILTLPQSDENKAIITMAIRNNSLVNQELKNLLITYASDVENTPGVRGTAIESLARFDLTSEEKSNITSFVDNLN